MMPRLLLVLSLYAPTLVQAQAKVAATMETQSAPTAGDSLTDVALWRHPTEAQKSLILVTDQLAGGLLAYQMDGGQWQQLPNPGMGVDVRQNLSAAVGFSSLIVVLRATGELDFFEVALPSRNLRRVNARSIPTALVPMGVSFFRAAGTNQLDVFVAGAGGAIQQWRVVGDGGTVDAQMTRSFTINGAPADILADDTYGQVWVSLLGTGVWQFDAAPDAGASGALLKSVASGSELSLPVRALALYEAPSGAGYWVVSSGEDRFSVFSRVPPFDFRGSFQVVPDGGVDGVSVANGLYAASDNLGASFPRGLLLALDGLNDSTPNVKMVSWQRLASAFNPPLDDVAPDGGVSDGGGNSGGATAPGGWSGTPTQELPTGCNCQAMRPQATVWLAAGVLFALLARRNRRNG